MRPILKQIAIEQFIHQKNNSSNKKKYQLYFLGPLLTHPFREGNWDCQLAEKEIRTEKFARRFDR